MINFDTRTLIRRRNSACAMSVAKEKKKRKEKRRRRGKKKLTTRLDKLAIKGHAGNTSQKIDTRSTHVRDKDRCQWMPLPPRINGERTRYPSLGYPSRTASFKTGG